MVLLQRRRWLVILPLLLLLGSAGMLISFSSHHVTGLTTLIPSLVLGIFDDLFDGRLE